MSPIPAAPGHRRRPFYRRFLAALGLAGVLITVSLGLGIVGYHHFAGFSWIDSLLNAAMILTGMGPVGTLETNAAKLFASAYALFSGVAFITATGILLSPMFHRVLHRFHIDEKDMH
ncbi:MAG: hypothetical protein ACHQ4G_01640 [Opitutales bacterium]